MPFKLATPVTSPGLCYSLRCLLLMAVSRTVSGKFTDIVLYDMLIKLRNEIQSLGVSLKTLLAMSLVNLLLIYIKHFTFILNYNLAFSLQEHF